MCKSRMRSDGKRRWPSDACAYDRTGTSAAGTNRQRGAALIEAAIVFGLLLLLIIGGLDFAMQLHVRHRMTGASREAARAMAVKKGTTAQATTAAMNQLKGINATFTVSFPAPSDPQDVKVQISVPRRQISLGFFSGPKGAAVTTETTMRKEI